MCYNSEVSKSYCTCIGDGWNQKNKLGIFMINCVQCNENNFLLLAYWSQCNSRSILWDYLYLKGFTASAGATLNAVQNRAMVDVFDV